MSAASLAADAVAKLRRDVNIAVNPDLRGPVSLAGFFDELNLLHVALDPLTCGRVAEHLRMQGIAAGHVGEPGQALAGFMFFAGGAGFAFVNAADPLERRRFTAAHELGHAVLHREQMGAFAADTPADLVETADAGDPVEREANAFAAELLMPEPVLRARERELRDRHGCCPRQVLRYRLAAELLVSREALGYRLNTLRVGDE